MALLTRVEDADLAVFLEDFGAGELVKATPLAAGSVNSNFYIRSSRGFYFLRLYEEQDLAGARRDAETAVALAAAGVPTPPPIRRSGSDPSVVGVLAGKPAALLPWIDGEILCQKRVTPAHAREVGRALAAMHVAGAPLAARYGTGRFDRDALAARIDRIEHASDPRIASKAPALREALAEISAARATDLPRGLAHGDLFRDNVLFAPNAEPPRVLALLDFESAYEGSLVFDLMVTVLAWCVGDMLDEALARSMVAGYETVRPLEPRERAAAWNEARFAAIRFWITRLTDYAMRLGVGNGRDPGRFEMRLRTLEAMGSEGLQARIRSA